MNDIVSADGSSGGTGEERSAAGTSLPAVIEIPNSLAVEGNELADNGANQSLMYQGLDE